MLSKIPVMVNEVLIGLICGCSQSRDVVYHCSPRTAIAIAFSPTGDVAAVQTAATEMALLSTASWKVTKCKIPTRRFTFVDPNLVALIGEDERIHMVDPRTGKSTLSFPIPGHPVRPAAVCGRYLCVPVRLDGAAQGLSTILVMDLQGRVLKKFATLEMTAASPARRPLSASMDGRWLVVLGWDRAIVYKAGTWQKVADISGGFAKGYFGGFLTLCTFASNGASMYLGNDTYQEVIETGTWKRKAVHSNMGHHIQAALPNPNKTGFLVLLSDGSLRDSSDTLIRVVPGPPDGQLGGCYAAAFGPQGLLLTGWENGDIRKQVVTLN